MKRPSPNPPWTNRAMLSPAADWVRQWGQGDLIACSTLQPGLQRFETTFGYIAYQRVLGMDITLGGPVCAPTDRRELLDRFLAHSRRPIFFYLRADLLTELAAHPAGGKLHCAGIGVDRHVDLGALGTAPAKPIQSAVRKARQANLRLARLDLAAVDQPLRCLLQAVTAQYLAYSEITREMTFLNRPMSYVPDGMRRVYTLAKHDREHDGIFGYAVLNPIYQAGRVTAYLLDILRFTKTRLWGVWLSVVQALAAELQREGLGLSLGFCPLHQVQRPPAGRSALLQPQINWMARYLASAQYLTRLRELKDLIPGSWEPRYLASFSPLAPVVLCGFMEAMGLSIGQLFGPDLLRVLQTGIKNRLSPEAA